MLTMCQICPAVEDRRSQKPKLQLLLAKVHKSLLTLTSQCESKLLLYKVSKINQDCNNSVRKY